ncbi:MAG: PorP/SprF family type IX secretion system membrane protein [Cytophagaceae bacterium]
MKKLLPLISLLIISSSVLAQPINRLSNYYYNQIYFNPGATGMFDQELNVSLLNAFQWVGVNGAPMKTVAWADFKSRESGLSCAVLFDRMSFGASKRVGAYINPGYSMLLGYKLRLSVGLRVGFEQLNFNPSGLTNVFDENDEILGTNSIRQSFTKVGAGIQLRSDKFHIGISSADLFRGDKNNYYNPDTSGFLGTPRNYVANVDYRIKISDSYAFVPMAIAYAYKGREMVAGGGFMFEIQDYFWAGINAYSNKIANLSLGTHISSRIRFVYSYEMTFNKTLPSNLGSHEINLLYRMDKIVKKK